MNTYHETRISFQKMDETGKEKKVTESYLIDSMSVTEAETRIIEELQPYIDGEIQIKNVKPSNYSEIVKDDTCEKFFKCKITIIVLDEEKGKEKKTNTYTLVQSDTVKEAYDKLNDLMQDSVSEFEIPAISESNIVEIIEINQDKVLESE